MARKKISEYTAKKLLYHELDLPYRGLAVDSTRDTEKQLQQLDTQKTYVIKVDEGIKKRMKNGLVALNKRPSELFEEIQRLQKKGFTQFIIEPFLLHPDASEKYLSIERTREGLQVLYSEKGGVAIEEKQDAIKKFIISYAAPQSNFLDFHTRDSDIEKDFGLAKEILQKLLRVFDAYHFSFLEINPLIVDDGKVYLLDVACEVDSAGEFFIKDAWGENDFRIGEKKEKTEEEKAIAALAAKSPSAFSLEILNPEGSIFVLLLGGGASIVLADEVYNQGYGKELANYGEASGNPNAEEVYLYAKNILQLLLKSKAKKKVFIVAGGVANFSDLRVLFKGLTKAIAEGKDQLRKQQVHIFVRRGGPYQEEGLAQIKSFLEKEGLLGLVAGPEMVLTDVVHHALKGVQR